jgi:predicted RNA-binding protein Jag
VKDAVYSAASVEEALRVASRSLGVTVGELRYLVLDPGGEERIAQIAVLLDAMRPRSTPAAPRTAGREAEPLASRSDRIRRWFEVLSETLGSALDVEVEDAGAGGVRVRLIGEASSLDPDEWSAVEMLLRRAFGPPRVPGRLSLQIPGRREDRDAGLRDLAHALAAAVRSDGEPRATEPLNSYERRLVHVAVGEVGGLVTESLGDGALRSVSIRLAESPAEP